MDVLDMRVARLIVAGTGVSAALALTARTAVAAGHLALGIGFVVAAVLIAAAAFALEDEATEEPRQFGPGGERWSMSGDDFESLVREVEAARTEAPAPMDDFDRLVIEAIDQLPGWVQAELDANVAVIVAADGDRPENYGHAGAAGLFGLYAANWLGPDRRDGARIVIFKDTLLRHFRDPDDLRREIGATLRHEIAHHFGADEEAVRRLGL